MSRTIDSRVVEMQFDNKQFESNVKTTMSTLDKLKQSLNMTGSYDSMSGLSGAVESVRIKFSALEVMAVTALANITNSVINAGKRLISSLTIDPIKTGLEEYETKINAIQTILTNTKSKGTTLDDVNKALAELNTYSDKTIYNFAEMAKNIGTFTAAGVDLNTSVSSIKGIANLAAGSGSSALQASTAMYQLSQAIAAGSVKLMDWNSVVNAGMGGELFQNALRQTAKEMGIVVDAGKPFRETLESGWLTADVLTKTLSKFAEDESLIKAATQVKTFTQLIDTMKESVQSGWAQSWEAIIGDKDQAAAFFTSINDGFGAIIGSSAEARNKMLAFWNANGGRDALIDALSNSFKGLMSVLKPIGEAFREIFPAMTAERLIEITKNFRDLTTNFKIGAETSENLKNTFKGLFAILDIGRQAFMAIINIVGSFISALLPVGSGVLGITGSFGEYLVIIDEMLKKTKAFQVAALVIGDIFKFIADGIKGGLDVINGMLDSFKGFDSFSKKTTDSLEPVASIGDRIHNTFSKVADIFKNESSIFYKFASAVGDAFEKMAERITDSIQSISFERLVDVFNGALLTGILLGIKKLLDTLRGFASDGMGIFSSITETLDAVKGCLVAYQTQLKAGALLKIAIAMGILATSLYVLAGIDSDKITSGLTAITIMFGELIGSMALLQMSMGPLGLLNMAKLTIGMIGLATAVLILSGAMKKLADLDWEGIAKGLVSVGVLCGVLIASAQLMSTNAGIMIRGALGMIVFTEAVSLLADVVIKLSAIDWNGLAKGLVGVSGLLIELALFAKFADVSKMGIINSVGLIILAEAINILATAVQKFAAIDIGVVVKGLTALGVVLTELALFVNLTGNAKNVITTSIGLIAIAGAMMMLSTVIGSMGNLSLASLAKGLTALGLSLAMIMIAFNAFPKNAFTTVFNSLAFLDMASAIMILSKALIAMGNMSWDQVGRSLTAMGASLAMIITAFALLKNSIVDAAAMLIFTSSLFILSQALQALGTLSLAQIGTSLLALAGVFGILGIAGLLLGPMIPVILGLAGALTLLGIGVAAIGGGIFLLGTGLTAIAVAGTAAAAALVALVSAVAGLLPMIAQQLAEAVIEFARVIGEGAPAIVEAFVSMLSAFIDGIVEATPKILEGFLRLLTGILDSLIKYGPNILESLADLLVAFMKTIAEHAPDIVKTFLEILVTFLKNMVDYIPKITEAGIKILLGFLKGVADNIQKVVETAIDVVINFIKGVASKIGDTIQAGIDLMVAFINGLADGIRNNTDVVIAAVKNLMSALIYAAKQVLIASVTGFTDIGSDIIDGLINGLRNGLSRLMDAAENVAISAYNSAKKALGINSPSKMFAEIGAYSVEGFAIGLQNISGVVSSAKDMGNMAINSLKDAISNVADVVSGDLDLAPTIRPVLDLTDVQAGKKSLNSMFSDGLNVTGTNGRVSSMSSEIKSDSSTLGALIDALSNTTKTENQSVLSFEGMFKGAEFNVRSDSDITKIAKQVSQEIFKLNQSVSRGRGLASI